MTSILPQRTLDALAAIQIQRMPDTAEELAHTRPGGAMGGTTDSWTTVLQTFPCRVVPGSNGQSQSDVSIGSITTTRQIWRITGPVGLTINPSSRLRVNGKVYAVIADDTPHTFASVTNILCYEVN